MQQAPPETPLVEVVEPLLPAPVAAGRRGWRPRFGIGSRLALGLAAVAAVILVGHGLATRTTRQSTEAVRRMQSESEPLARRANAVLERLVAYDRSVSEYLQAGRSSDFGTITTAGEALQSALTTYYDSTAAAAQLPSRAKVKARSSSTGSMPESGPISTKMCATSELP